MFLFQFIDLRKSMFDAGALQPPQARKQRLLFVSRMLWCSFPKITQGRFQGSPGLFVGGPIYALGDRLQYSQEHLDSTMAIRKEIERFLEVVCLHPNLYGHAPSLAGSRVGARTKLSFPLISPSISTWTCSLQGIL